MHANNKHAYECAIVCFNRSDWMHEHSDIYNKPNARKHRHRRTLAADWLERLQAEVEGARGFPEGSSSSL